MGQIIQVLKCLDGETEGKKLLRRCRRSWKDNIQMDVQAVGFEDVDCLHLKGM
jgi:hypothetical protein